MTPVEEIKSKLDIVDFIRSYIPLLPAGKNFKAVCPFHKEKTPSFIVSPDRQTWHCFGACNAGGDVFTFLMKYENLEFYEALKILAEKAGIELRRLSPADQKQFGILYDLNNLAKEFFKKSLFQSREALDYIKSRGLKKETVEEFELGLSPRGFENLMVHLLNLGFDVKDIERAGLIVKTVHANSAPTPDGSGNANAPMRMQRGLYVDRFRDRIIFPIYNSFGKIVGFTGRILPQFDTGEMGKYVNSPETPIFNKSRILYGFHKTKQAVKDARSAVLVEGQMDFLMLYQDGVKNVIATSGTALTPDHLLTLRRFADEVILAFDNDEAGHKATLRSIDIANSLDFSVKTLSIGAFKDPAEVAEKEPGKIKEFIENAVHAMQFYMRRYLGDAGSGKLDVGSLKKALRLVLQKIKIISSPIEQAHWIKELAIKTGMPEKAITEEMEKMRIGNRNEKVEIRKEERFDRNPGTRREIIAERLLVILLNHDELLSRFTEYSEYVPALYIEPAEKLLRGERDGEMLADLSFRSSLAQPFDDDLLEQEFESLLYELKREYLKEERERLLMALKTLEGQGSEAELQAMLRRFDEISKMMHT